MNHNCIYHPNMGAMGSKHRGGPRLRCVIKVKWTKGKAS